MILTYKCQNCKNENTLPFKLNDRGEFSYREKSDLIQKCHHCNFKNSLNANDVKAVESKSLKFVFAIAFMADAILGSIIFDFFELSAFNLHLRSVVIIFGLIICIPFLIAIIIVSSERKAIKIFNEYYV